jgi:hypothetical protein
MEESPITLERSLPFALYQQYIILPFFLLIHPLAIGLLLPAPGTADWHCTLGKFLGQGPIFVSTRDDGGVYLAQLVSPHPPTPPYPQRMSRDDPFSSHFEYLTAFNAQKRSHGIGINERLGLFDRTHLFIHCFLTGRNTDVLPEARFSWSWGHISFLDSLHLRVRATVFAECGLENEKRN